jgi:hypothetical protein
MRFLFGTLLLSAVLSASTPEEVTVFTFSAPVQVPGRVLAPGQYLFKLDQHEELNVVKIESPDERKVFGVFLVKPDYLMQAPSKPGLLFESRGPGSPQAIKAWFYPGDKYANEFIYRK